MRRTLPVSALALALAFTATAPAHAQEEGRRVGLGLGLRSPHLLADQITPVVPEIYLLMGVSDQILLEPSLGFFRRVRESEFDDNSLRVIRLGAGAWS